MQHLFLLAFLMLSFPALAAGGGYAGVIAPPPENDTGGDETPTYYSFAPRAPAVASPVLRQEEEEEEAALSERPEAPVNTVLPPLGSVAGNDGLDQRRRDIQKIIADRKLSESQKIGHLNAERTRLQQEKIQKALLDAQLQYQKLQKRNPKR